MRLFIAFSLPNEVFLETEKIVNSLQSRLHPARDKIKWTTPETRHVTLEFLGEISEVKLPEILDTIHQQAAKCPKIKLRLSTLTCFPDIYKPSVLVAKVEADENAHSWQSGLRHALQDRKLTSDANIWCPHITLGRFKKGVQIDEHLLHSEVNKIFWEPTDAVLYQSVFQNNETKYIIIESVKLG